MSQYVIFLGAGASAAEGAPLQRDLFASYFTALRETGEVDTISGDVAAFFRLAFDIDVTNPQPAKQLPTFEEVMGLIDIAVSRREGLHGVPLESRDGSGLDLRTARRSLVLVMADAIRRAIPGASGLHRSLVTALKDEHRLSRTSFITTNYDTLMDDALYDCAPGPGEGLTDPIVDYGFNDIVPSSLFRPNARESFLLLKIHGSLNWLHCPVCSDLVVTYGPDIVERLILHPETARCTRCDTMREPIIVPPTYFKDLSNVYLAIVWARSARLLRDCSHIVFCGYSLPDADMHVKYLVKTGQMNRQPAQDPLKLSLVNQHDGKSPEETEREQERYARFFGDTVVVDTKVGFEEFARHPGSVLEPSR